MSTPPEPYTQVPRIGWVFGALGLVPFAAGAIACWVADAAARGLPQIGLLVYGGFILCFLGGGRWGLEIGGKPPRNDVIVGSMAGSIVSTVLIAATMIAPAPRLVILAVAHFAQWAWDVRSTDTPGWYSKLRHVLTAGAVLSLLAGSAASFHG